MPTRPVFLHVGASKTGTSALQRGLFASASELAAQGLGMPLRGRPDHVDTLLRPLGWVPASGFVDPLHRNRLAELGTRVRGTPGERLLITCEDLCEADAERIGALVSTLRDHGTEPHVVLSVRGLAAVIPSEWQQFLKHRLALDYPTFLDLVRDRTGLWAAHFWQRQDVIETATRWGEAVGLDHVHVVVTPDRRVDPDGLYRMFGDVLGFEPDLLPWPSRDVNGSWGYVEAEVYRRVNDALGPRLPRYDADYQPGVRWPFVQDVLPRAASDRIPLPPEHLPWVSDTAQQHIDYLEDSGVHLNGDPSALVPTAEDVADLPELDEAEVARAAIETLANLAVFTLERQQRLLDAGAQDRSLAGRARRTAKRLLGRS